MNEKSLVAKKIHPYISKILQILISFTQIDIYIIYMICIYIYIYIHTYIWYDMIWYIYTHIYIYIYIFLFFDKCLFTLSITQSVYSEQPTAFLARKHLSTMLLTNFDSLNSTLNIFQETQDFLVLTVLTRFLSFNYLYIFKNHRQTFPWPAERPSSHLRVTQMWFGPNIH